MDIDDLKKEKQLLESRIDSLIATFLNEHNDVSIKGLEIEIHETKNVFNTKVICVHTSISLTL